MAFIAQLIAQTGPPNVITTVAGNGLPGFDGDTGQPGGGPIRFAGISSILRDGSGNWIIADYGNSRTRRLSPDFAVATTILGTGSWVRLELSGNATDSSIDPPVGLTLANDKVLYVQSENEMSSVDLGAGRYNLRIGDGGRVSDGPGIDATGTGTSIAYHPDGKVFFATPFVSSTSTARVRVFDPATNLVKNLTPNGASGIFKGDLHVAMSHDHVLYAIDGEAFNVFSINPTTGALTSVLGFRNLGIKKVTNVVAGPSQTLFVADAESQKVFRLNLESAGSGAVQAVAGNGAKGLEGIDGPALDAQLAGPRGLYWDEPSGRLYIGETQGSRLLAVDPDGVLRFVTGSATPGYSGDDKPSPSSATESRMGLAGGLTTDGSGNVYTCEPGIYRIRSLTPATGVFAHVAGHGLSGGLTTNMAVDTFIGGCVGHAFDPATKSLYVIDYSEYLKRIDTNTGTISTVSNTIFRNADGRIAMVRGNVVIADTGARRLLMVTPQGVVSTIAGTGASTGDNPLVDVPAAQAVLLSPASVAAAADGTIYFTTNQGTIIRSLGTDGIVRHIGGSVTSRNAGDGGPAKLATFGRITVLAVDARKRIFVGVENMIRLIDEQGNVNLFAGNSTAGFAGDGGNPLGALFRRVAGLAVDSSGVVFVGDVNNGRIRRIGPATSAAVFSITSGNGQLLDLGALSRPLTVEVRNSNGQPVAGTVIRFQAENGELSSNAVTTGANGTASVMVKAGPELGTVRVIATQSGLGQLVFDLKAIGRLKIGEVANIAGSDIPLAPGSLARAKIENARGEELAFSVAFGQASATVIEGSAASGVVMVAVPDTLDAGSVEVVATEGDRSPSTPLPVTLQATAPWVLGCETVDDTLNCRITGYGRAAGGVPAASASALIDGVESETVEFLVKSPGVAEIKLRIPADFVSSPQERVLIVRVGDRQTEAKVPVGRL